MKYNDLNTLMVSFKSLPSWERGLKYYLTVTKFTFGIVAPLVGARIEIYYKKKKAHGQRVAPLVGARIEIGADTSNGKEIMSLPSWERGLKLCKMGITDILAPSLPSWERGLKF